MLKKNLFPSFFPFFGGMEILKYLGERDNQDLQVYNVLTNGSDKN